MPRPVTVPKGSVLAAALEIVRREGGAALSARAIASELGCSTHPIYTAFSDMADLEEALLAEARAFLQQALLVREPGEGMYEGIGLRLLAFSRQEQELFRWIMQSGRMHLDFERDTGSPEFEAVGKRMVEDPDLAGLSAEALARINRSLWFFTYGLAVSLSDGLVEVEPKLARRYMNDAARSLIGWEQSQRTRPGE